MVHRVGRQRRTANFRRERGNECEGLCGEELYLVSILMAPSVHMAKLTVIDGACGRVAPKDVMTENESSVSRTGLGVVRMLCMYGTLDGC